MRSLLSFALLITLGSAANANDVIPSDCTQILTVQTRDCTVEQHFICPVPQGDHRVLVHDASGGVFYAHNNAETQWLNSRSLPDGVQSTTIMPPRDPVSLSTLLADNYDSYSFEQRVGDVGVLRYVGYDRLTGESVEIDGVTLLRTEFLYREINTQTDEVLLTREGQQFVSPTLRLYFGGIDQFSTPEGEFTADSTPVEFLFPDDPRFLSATPLHGCEGLMSGLTQPENHA